MPASRVRQIAVARQTQETILVLPMAETNYYETGALLAQYLLFHYGDPGEVSPHATPPPGSLEFPARCAALCLESTPEDRRGRALDLGCAVGGATFELTRACDEVLGVDYSKLFIDACLALKRDGRIPYRLPVEGDISVASIARLPAGIRQDNARFLQGDACALPADIGRFGIVLMANLLDRLADPGACLARLPSLVLPGGTLVVTTPCTWMPGFTPREKWLGGRLADGGPLRTSEALRERLQHDFEPIASCDLPFLIREHARKFQWSVAMTTVWRRKG